MLIASAPTLTIGDVPLWAYSLPVLETLALELGLLLHKRRGAVAMPVYQRLCIQCLSAAAVFALFAWHARARS